MSKFLIFEDNMRIPIDDVSDQSVAICYPESMTDFEEIWPKCTPTLTNHQVAVVGEEEFDIFNPEDLHFNKIELEHCSTGLLMRIIFASSMETEFRKVTTERDEYKHLYEIMHDGAPVEEVTVQ